MDDRELAMIIRERNKRYVEHISKQEDRFNPTQLMRQNYNDEELEGGFLSAIAAAARIAARLAIQVAKQAAKQAAKAARQGAKLAQQSARQGAKAAKTAARNAAKAARSAGKFVRRNASDIAEMAVDVGMMVYEQAEQIKENAKLKANTITDEEWNDLDDNEKIFVDWNRWTRELDKDTYNLWKSRGGDKNAALQTLRLREAGLDPDDWAGAKMMTEFDRVADGYDDIYNNPPEENEECQNELDIDDRSDAEKYGVMAASVFDMGISEAISEAEMEKRARGRYDRCVDAKRKIQQALKKELDEKMNIGPGETFDPDDPKHIQHIGDLMAAENPIFKKAMELDELRRANGLPPIDEAGAVLNDPDTIANNRAEKIAIYFINNQTLEYDNVGWIKDFLREDADIVQRAIAKIPYYSTFCSDIDAFPEMKDFKDDYTSGTAASGRNSEVLERWYEDNEEIADAIEAATENVQGNDEARIAKGVRDNYEINKQYNYGDLVKYNGKVYRCIKTVRSLPFASYADSIAAEVYDNGKTYRVGTLIDFNGIIYRMKDYTGGAGYDPASRPDLWTALGLKDDGGLDPDFWEELSLYNDHEYTEIEQMGNATLYLDYKQYLVDDYVIFQGFTFRMYKDAPAGTDPTNTNVWEKILLNDKENIYPIDNVTEITAATGTYLVPNQIYKMLNRTWDNSTDIFTWGALINKKIGTTYRYFACKNVSGAPKYSTIFNFVDKANEKNEDGTPKYKLTTGIEEINQTQFDDLLEPGTTWKPSGTYKTGDEVVWTYDNNQYIALKDVPGNTAPDNTEYWKRVRTYTVSPEMITDLKISQRAGIFANAAAAAEDYDPNNIYRLHQIVNSFDGKYYELILEKKDKAGKLLRPPMPPEPKYWKLVSDGITEFEATKSYEVNDMVNYTITLPFNKGTSTTTYIATHKPPVGTLPTNKNYWKDLDPVFEAMDEETIQANAERLKEAIIETAEDYVDDIDAKYEIGEIVQLFDNDGYPDFYKCIKDTLGGQASIYDRGKAEPYDNGKVYSKDNIVWVADDMTKKENSVLYKMKDYIGAAGYGPGSHPQSWDFVGYFSDPGPPNPEFWKPFSEVETEAEKQRDIRDNAISANDTSAGVFLDDIVFDPSTEDYYKLIIRDDIEQKDNGGNLEERKLAIFTRDQIKKIFSGPFDEELWIRFMYNRIDKAGWMTDFNFEEQRDGYIKRIFGSYPTADEVLNKIDLVLQQPGQAVYTPTSNNIPLDKLPPFEGQTEDQFRYGNIGYMFEWEPTEVKSKEEAKIENIEEASMWKKNLLYKEGDLITDDNGQHYVCIKDTTIMGLPPHLSYTHFRWLTPQEWDEAVVAYTYAIKDQVAQTIENESITWFPGSWDKPRSWGEVVYYEGKYYSFIPFTAIQQGATDGSDTTTKYIPTQRMIIDLNGDKVQEQVDKSFNRLIEWNQCTQIGEFVIVKNNDTVRFLNFAYEGTGPIVKHNDKYYVYNGGNKEIFGYTGNYYGWQTNAQPYNTFSIDQTNQAQQAYGMPPDTYWVQVFQDGKPVNKHDPVSGVITGQNVDTSSLPPEDAADVQDAVDKTTGKTNCPTLSAVAEVDNSKEEEATTSTYAKDLKAWEIAHAEWVLKSPTDSTLVEPVKPQDPALVGKGGKVKRKYVRKNKTIKK